MYAFSIDVPQPLAMYEQVLRALQESGADKPPERLLHLCVPTQNGFRVTEVWETHEAVDRYGDEVMRPTIEKVAGPDVVAAGPPESQEFELLGLSLRGERVAP